ncbi:MAG TPA: TetR/AcrR family transcriptional regulator [Prolixibacteraceae bacterium]|nr:TetR/AcrR family transcriptional regulator [Prolixibacteraceae bacterium]HQN92719.1 TetR/AcrR family transcriptional regulator [Prolixibacteraceae bacterium]
MDIRNKIIEGAGELFVENGIKLVTMDMIAQSIGISKRTIYENFRDKNDLVNNFISLAMVDHKKRAYEILAGSKNVIEALFKFGEYNHKTMKSINPCFFDDIKKYHPDVFEKIMNNGSIRNYEITYLILKRGINEGIFRKEIDIEIANLFIHNSFEFISKLDEEKHSHHKVWLSVHLPYLRGICTEKGNELLLSFTKLQNQNSTTP